LRSNLAHYGYIVNSLRPRSGLLLVSDIWPHVCTRSAPDVAKGTRDSSACMMAHC